MTLILQEKIGNIVFLKLHIFLEFKIDMNHFYPKIPTGAQISTQRPTLHLEFLYKIEYNCRIPEGVGIEQAYTQLAVKILLEASIGFD